MANQIYHYMLCVCGLEGTVCVRR